MLDEVMQWLYSIGATRQALLFAAVGLFLCGLGVFFIWLGSRGDEYRGVRKRRRNPTQYDRDPVSGEYLLVPKPPADATRAFPAFVPAAEVTDSGRIVSHHSAERMGGATTNIGGYVADIAKARAMVPRESGEVRRSLSVDWRDAWIVTGAHPSVYHTDTRLTREEVEEDGDYPR